MEPSAEFMRLACELAKLGSGHVNPNPQVGCVIVKNGEVIGSGYHSKFGAPHAEREALADCSARAKDNRATPEGADVYVTLEPCAHTGKTPPCVDALIEAKVGRVIVGSADPNPLVSGAGIAKLREAGIEVITNFCTSECDSLNEPFFHYIKTGKPLVIAKYAMTLDGKMQTISGKSKWITSEASRFNVHSGRARYAAILVGVNTIINDNPSLNVRFSKEVDSLCHDKTPSAHQPLRVIVDTSLRTPYDSKVVSTANEQKTIIFTCNENKKSYAPYEAAGCDVINVAPDANGRVDLPEVITKLAKLGTDSVIIEGGATLLQSAFDALIVNKVQAYIAPKIFAGVSNPADAQIVHNINEMHFDGDYLIEGDLD